MSVGFVSSGGGLTAVKAESVLGTKGAKTKGLEGKMLGRLLLAYTVHCLVYTYSQNEPNLEEETYFL